MAVLLLLAWGCARAGGDPRAKAGDMQPEQLTVPAEPLAGPVDDEEEVDEEDDEDEDEDDFDEAELGPKNRDLDVLD